MDKYFGSDSETDLPQAKQIQRSDFQGETFDSGEFLLQFHEFQKLEDLKAQLDLWHTKLSQELTDIVNQDYPQLVGLNENLQAGSRQLSDIKVDVEQYKQELINTLRDLETTTSNAKHMTEQKRQLAEQRAQCEAAVEYISMIDSLEMQLSSLDEVSGQDDDYIEDTVVACEWLARILGTRAYLEDLWPNQAAITSSNNQVGRLKSRLQLHVNQATSSAGRNNRNSDKLLDLFIAKRELLGGR